MLKKLLFLIPLFFLIAGSTVELRSVETVSYELVKTVDSYKAIKGDVVNNVAFQSEYLLSKKIHVAYKLHVSIGQEVKAQYAASPAGAQIGINRATAIPSDFVPLVFDIGQSNSVGRAEADRQVQLTQYPELPSRVPIYYKPNYLSTDNGSFQNIFIGSDNTREPDQSSALTIFGGYQPLGALLASGYNRTAYVVMMGDGGTALKSGLTNPDWDPAGLGECFQTATSYYYTVAYGKIQIAEPGKTIVPLIVWHQGETDAMDATATSQYATNFAAFVTALRASHTSLANAPLFITKLNFNQTAGETTINAVFDAYQAAHTTNTRIIDISDMPRKVDLTVGQKGGISPSATDDNHESYLAQNAKGERVYAGFNTFYNLTPTSEITNNTGFDPSTITSTGVRLQFNKSNASVDGTSTFTALTNNLSTGTFSTFAGSPNPKYKFDYGYKGWGGFVVSSGARVASSANIGNTLFQNSTGYSFAFWIKPRDGQTAASQTIFHDIASTAAPTNSRLGCIISTTGKINVFLSIGGTTKQATTNTAIFADGVQDGPKHIAVTVTAGDFIRIYVNGVLQTLDATDNGNISALTLTSYNNTVNVLQVGATRTGASTYTNYYIGLMRELVIQPGVIYNTTNITNLMLD